MRSMVITAVLGVVSAFLWARQPSGTPPEAIAQNAPTALPSLAPRRYPIGMEPQSHLNPAAMPSQQWPAQASGTNPPPPPEVRNPPNIYIGDRPSTSPPVPGVIPNQPPMKK